MQALGAVCHARMGAAVLALQQVDEVLGRLQHDLHARPVHQSLSTRWYCVQALSAIGDARASPLLAALAADMQARATVLAEGGNVAVVVRRLPEFRAIAAACQP